MRVASECGMDTIAVGTSYCLLGCRAVYINMSFGTDNEFTLKHEILRAAMKALRRRFLRFYLKAKKTSACIFGILSFSFKKIILTRVCFNLKLVIILHSCVQEFLLKN